MSKKVIQCPVCGGQRIQVSVPILYHQYYTIEDGKLYKASSSSAGRDGLIWLTCLDCIQKENPEPMHNWPANTEQENLLRQVLYEPRSVDISKQMNQEK